MIMKALVHTSHRFHIAGDYHQIMTDNDDGNGVIPVAILGSETFDVNQIDPYSVTLEGMGVKMVGKADRALSHIEDVNDDGFDDLVVQIQDEDGIFEPGIGEAIIMGLLEDGRNFEGSDYICVTQ